MVQINKLPKEKEALILKTYANLKSIRKTSKALKISHNTVARITKENKENNPKIQKGTPSRGLDNPHNSGFFHCWVETEPLRLRSISQNSQKQELLRQGRLRFLMEKGDTLQLKEYHNLKNSTYWIYKGDNWRAKITTKTISISIKLIGKDPLSLMNIATDIIFTKIQELHKSLGSIFYINAGTPTLRFKTSSSEFGLISPKVYDKLKSMGFRFWSDGFNNVYLDKSPKKSIESSGLDSSLFIDRFSELLSWLFDNSIADIATKKDVTMALIKTGVIKEKIEPNENLSNYIG